MCIKGLSTLSTVLTKKGQLWMFSSKPIFRLKGLFVIMRMSDQRILWTDPFIDITDMFVPCPWWSKNKGS